MEGVLPFSTTQLQYNWAVVFKILLMPMALEHKSVFFQKRTLRLNDVFKGLVLLKAFEFVFTSHGPISKDKVSQWRFNPD